MTGKFQVLIKRYREWGDPMWRHSYHPPGAVSTYVHNLKVGDKVSFKHIPFNVKLPYINDGVKGFKGVKTITMIAVGAGLAPMIQVFHRSALAPDPPRTARRAPRRANLCLSPSRPFMTS